MGEHAWPSLGEHARPSLGEHARPIIARPLTGTAGAGLNRGEDGSTAGPSSVYLVPNRTLIRPGSTFTLGAGIDAEVDLGGFEFTLRFDPEIIQVDQVTLGDFLGSSGRAVRALGPQIDNEAGHVRFGGYSYGSQPGAAGSGVLAYVVLRARGAGRTLLEPIGVQIANTAAEAQATTVSNGEVVVGFLIDLPLTLK